MSFAAGFYSLSVELNNVDADSFASFRVKTPLHPNESLEHLYARFVAFVHAYHPGQEFTKGLFEPKEPTIWRRDVTGDIQTWIQVGVPEKRKLELALRSGPDTEYRVYFYEADQLLTFSEQLKGSKTNWIEPIEFYKINSEFLSRLTAQARSSSVWSVTCIDNHLYLVCDGNEYETTVRRVNPWETFQVLVGNN